MTFALSCRSDFSVGESLLQIDQMVAAAVENKIHTLGLVDTNLSSMVDFSKKCGEAGIRPVIGFRVRVVDDPRYRKPTKASGIAAIPNHSWTAKVYLKSDAAMESVLKLLSKANSAEYFYYVPRVGLTDLLELKDVVVTSGDLNSLFSHPEWTVGDRFLRGAFGDDYYAELTPANTPLFDRMNFTAMKSAAPKLTGLPVLYAKDEDADSRDVLNAVCTNTKMADGWRSIPYLRDFSMVSAGQIKSRAIGAIRRLLEFHGADRLKTAEAWTEGVRNQWEIVDKCTYKFHKMPASLPVMAANEFGALCGLCATGWASRFSTTVLGHRPTDLAPYRERLKYELEILRKMEFSGYFLMVADLVTWAKANEVIVGPGRGSVGGSLVAYLLGITDVDPLRFGLLFERFINPDRIDLPDADLDFMSSKRHLVIEYLVSKYGKDHVAGISNYSTLASASALRDVGRMHGLSNLQLSATKLVPKEQGKSMSLEEAGVEVAELNKFKATNPVVWGHALKLEGAMRSFGQHAAGIVVAGEPIVKRAVLETRSSDLPVVNWDKRTVEDWGLIKMDLLGLSTLDVMEIAKQFIRKRHGKTINYLAVPLDEANVLEAFGRGETTGVFQFESGGMKRLLKDLRKGGPLTFDDITAATALYRPGPMDSGLMEDFVAIKQGLRAPYYEYPAMEAALTGTHGVIVYQEQVMQIARDVAGYSMADADKLRKIMGKKDKDAMKKERDKWIEGTLKTAGGTGEEAGLLFDKIEAFAGYGFNKSHAVEYSIISIWTMWLRVNFPAEYYAACLTIVKEEKLPRLVADAREAGIEVLPPDVNFSEVTYVIPDDKHILAPFGALLGCSDTTSEAIMKLRAREGGAFLDVAHFKRVCKEKGSKINARVVERIGLVSGFRTLDKAYKPEPDLRKRQLEFLPGLIIDAVKAERVADLTIPIVRAQIFDMIHQYRACTDCSLAGQPHPAIRMKTAVKFMVVSDCPSWEEEKKGKLLEGDGGAYLKSSIINAGLEVGHGYYTTLVKAKKDDKFLTSEQLNGCARHLDRELEIIKPAVIVALGSAAVRRFLPDFKGSLDEAAGKATYLPALDATLVCGINPIQIKFDPSKSDVLDRVWEAVASICS